MTTSRGRRTDRSKAASVRLRSSPDAEKFLVLFGRRIGDLRAAKGWTQKGFAELVGVSRQHMNWIETGRSAPTIIVVRAIASKLDVTVGELLENLADN